MKTEVPKDDKKLLKDILEEQTLIPEPSQKIFERDRSKIYIEHPRFETIRNGTVRISAAPMTTSDEIAFHLASHIKREEAEHPGVEIMAVMLLNSQNLNLGIETVATGTVSGVIVSPRQIFDIALNPKYRATAIILAHNHTSGDPQPSDEDLSAMREVKAVGDHIDCKLLDFIVIGLIGYYSHKNENYELQR